jgi:4-amino-4-deoxychorismate lyase
LDQVLARSEWNDPAIVEGLMLDEMDNVISCTQSNLFMMKGDRLFTPDLSDAGIAGITREVVLEYAAQFSLRPEVAVLGLDDLKQADALLITNSIMGVCPVAGFEERQYDLDKIPSELVKQFSVIMRGA